MIWALLIVATLVAASGMAFKFGIPLFRPYSRWNVDWYEYVAGLAVTLMVIVPTVFAVGSAWAKADALVYEEFRNGVETAATVQSQDCHPGTSGGSASSGHSNCAYEYQTGETYTYTETYTVTVTDECDSKGRCKSHTETRTRVLIGYIYNPYASKEYHYVITDSIGGTYTFPDIYVKDGEGYNGGSIPGEIPRGDPAEWLDAKRHLDEGDPRPVTRIFTYNNYILASHDDLLKPFSKDVKRYKKEGILPDHTRKIRESPLYGYSNSFADKVSFVGVTVNDESAWQRSMMGLNAALGSQLQGDMHLVLIDSKLVDSPTRYLNALKAYWLSDDFGRRAIAKNAIIVVAGVEGNTVSWALASTGMPFGNEVLLQGIANFLPDTPVTPEALIGAPKTVVTASGSSKDPEVSVTLSADPGVLERLTLRDFPFQRACMDCLDKKGNQIGYKNLIVEFEPAWWQWLIMIVIACAPALIFWPFAAKYQLFDWLPWVTRSKKSKNKYRFRD